MKTCPPFQPAKSLKNPHLQTLYPALVRRGPWPGTETETFELPDGDFVDCFWHPRRPDEKTTAPIVTLFHGLQGSYRSPYIRGMMAALAREGFIPVVMHFRGCSGRPNRLPRSYHSGDTADARGWLEHLHERYPDAPLYAVGYSLGGNMLLKLLGEWAESCPLKGAVSVSAPMRLDVSAERMRHGFSRLYQAYLLRDLKRSLLEKYDRFDMRSLLGLSRSEVRKLDNFFDFDDAYTAPVHGFASADEYYRLCSARRYLKHIAVPTCIIQALDDPFMTPEVLPEARELPLCVETEIFSAGGHVGFVSGSLFRPRYWLEERIPRRFEAR